MFSKRLSFELGVGATISEATREAGAPMIFLEHGAISGGVRDAAAGAGTWKIAGAAQWRCAASYVVKLDKSTSEPSLGASRGLHCALA